jgi:hypothetical protein
MGVPHACQIAPTLAVRRDPNPGEFRLYETQAFLRYLDRVLPQPALTPGDVRAAARMDQLMNIVDWYLFRGCGNIISYHALSVGCCLGSRPTGSALQGDAADICRVCRTGALAR